ncbi:hypothetical protein UFOVP1339_53 [uncultured Caudovirales phage]|uniref:Uncharacterized protein n=1 Tax=uncultured Caudovirales phage TaxID=2100421 RepID=A0A6J5RT67_9CAUD|nr:hypothetical protein UFOVP1339_53 [uncultured Caudovirales phage]
MSWAGAVIKGVYLLVKPTLVNNQEHPPLLDANGVLLTSQSGAAPLGGGLTWTKTVFTMNGASQTLLAANPARKEVIITNLIGNSQLAYDPLGAAVTLINGIQLQATDSDVWSGAECPLGAFTVIGTNTQNVLVYEGV